MAEALDHAVTVRDLLYVCAGFIGLIFFLWCSAALYLMRRDKRTATAKENLRNPVYGIPKDRTATESDPR
jgi:hypothetical protein